MRNACTVDGCDGPHYGHGLCSRHWQRVRHHGTTDRIGWQGMDPVGRFWQQVRKSDGCWLWIGSLNVGGYGVVRWGPQPQGGRGTKRPATQVAHELVTGQPWPVGMVTCHACDNPPCVRPDADHARPGTQQQNVQERFARIPGIIPMGERHGLHKLTELDVREARMLRARGATLAELRDRYGVALSTIHAAVTGKTWRHVV